MTALGDFITELSTLFVHIINRLSLATPNRIPYLARLWNQTDRKSVLTLHHPWSVRCPSKPS